MCRTKVGHTCRPTIQACPKQKQNFLEKHLVSQIWE